MFDTCLCVFFCLGVVFLKLILQHHITESPIVFEARIVQGSRVKSLLVLVRSRLENENPYTIRRDMF